MRSKKQCFAFQTFTETPTTTPSTLGFGITHQPHEGGDGAKCGAKFAATPCVISKEATSASEMRKETGKHPCRQPYSCAVSALGRTRFAPNRYACHAFNKSFVTSPALEIRDAETQSPSESIKSDKDMPLSSAYC